MTTQTLKIADLLAIRHRVKAQKPLIHCITNHISINDCANVVLAVGAKPIMAEHPAEVAEITASAQALAVNLGNISDTRMQSMLISGKAAYENKIPTIIDMVGVGCSQLRLDFAQKFIATCRPSIIKGNMSEIKALCGLASSAQGIDVGDKDVVTTDTVAADITMLKALAVRTGSVVVTTGVIDIITDGNVAYLIENGCEMLAMITGTGCMLNVLTAAFISEDILGGAVLATAFMGICGEVSQTGPGTGSFKTALLDSLFSLPDCAFSEKIKYSLR